MASEGPNNRNSEAHLLSTSSSLMEPILLKLQASPGSALHPVSPERINQQKMNGSPVHPSDVSPLQHKHTRTNSDVQAKVAFLNHLSRGNSPAPSHPSSTTTAALHRAILGREEAEASLQATLAELSEANSRERRVSERLESLMEELHSLKERQTHERTIFEKEVRRARKEAFRAGSALVKAQEELKSSRGEVRTLREELASEREAKEKAKQEAFERAYALVGLTEEMGVLKDKNRSFENDNQSDILEARAEKMRGESPKSRPPLVERAVGACSPTSWRLKPDRTSLSPRKSGTSYQIASPRLGSPLKINVSRRNSCKENEDPQEPSSHDGRLEDLKDDLEWERRLRLKAEDMVYFLKMECQFHRCSCRLAEMQGLRYIHDDKWDQMNREKEEKTTNFISNNPVFPQETRTVNRSLSPALRGSPTSASNDAMHKDTRPTEPAVAFCADTGTFKAVSPYATQRNVVTEPSASQHTISREVSPVLAGSHYDQAPVSIPVSRTTEIEMEDPRPTELQIEPPVETQNPIQPITQPPASLEPASFFRSFPRNLHIETAHFPTLREPADATTPTMTELMTASMTTTIPLHSDDYISSAACPIPGTPVTREEALAQIRARRGRAQTLKRSASANDAASRPSSRSRSRLANTNTTPIHAARRIPGMETASSRPASRVNKRDFSAPIGRY
ncbi:hypothetical protein AJ78_06022 [Emergomyces pasteurianus Ep9510]|uniref:Uncharacterized protein n=1 Tax=Emergomyces pasteurianus Ep9510 TaxID=1447872 RepID=A0A1J9PC41_9EURO|nr:hypothetical protein AJ78_06022 [Emergomyces pasteurianus Ep9510]